MLEDEIGTATTDAHKAKADLERTKADVANAEIAIDAYLEGSYLTQLNSLEKQLALAQAEYEKAKEFRIPLWLPWASRMVSHPPPINGLPWVGDIWEP